MVSGISGQAATKRQWTASVARGRLAFGGLAPVLLGLLAGAPAIAQFKNHDSKAPIDFAADRIEVQDQADRAVLSGNVRVVQGGMTLTAQRLTVNYTGKVVDGNPQASRLDASGNVMVRNGDQSASGQIGIYDLNRKLITMIGGVTLIQGQNRVSGNRVVINLATGRSTIDGSASSADAAPGTPESNGRVTGRLSVPQQSGASSSSRSPR